MGLLPGVCLPVYPGDLENVSWCLKGAGLDVLVYIISRLTTKEGSHPCLLSSVCLYGIT